MGSDATAAEQFGPYVVHERLGIGGMATVHRAVERADVEGFERVVALKRLLPHLAEDATFIKAFVREAKLAALLTHVNISQIYDLGRVGTQYFISMEYIDGCDLRRILRYARSINTPPPIDVTVGIMLQLCDALDYAHNKTDDAGIPLGLVHRDVSPSNLLIATSGHLKVIDFGIAKAQSLQLRTQTGRVKGKLAYMAPEAVLASQELDARSDIWAVGVILHELLTARPLFWSKNEYQTLIKIEHGDILPPSTLNPHCPPELDTIVIKALARDVNQRFASAADLRSELMRVRRDHKLATTERDIAHWLGPSLASILNYKSSNSSRPSPPQRASSPNLLDSPPFGPEQDLAAGDDGGTHSDAGSTVEPSSASLNESPGPAMPAPSGNVRQAPPLGPSWLLSSLQQTQRLGNNPPPNDPSVVPTLRLPEAPQPHLEPRRDTEPADNEEADPVWGTELAERAVVLDDVPDVTTKRTSTPSGSVVAPPPGVQSTNIGAAPSEGAPPPTGYRQAVRFSTFYPRPAGTSVEQPSPRRELRWPAQAISRLTSVESILHRRLRPWWIAIGLAIVSIAVAVFILVATTTESPTDQAQRSYTHGTIEIVVEPSDAIIQVGQQVHKGSPWTLELPAGAYGIVVDRLHYEPWRASVDLSLGELQRYRLALQPDRMSAASSGTAGNGDAALSVTTIPAGLEVILDGQLLNQRTPVTIAIRPGDHAIVVRQAGIERWWQGFRALPGSSYEFSPMFSTVTP